MENIEKSEKIIDKSYEEKLAILQAAKESKTMQLTLSPEGDLLEINQLNQLLDGKTDSPSEKYDLYYNGIRKVLTKYLPKGKKNEECRQIIYDEVNIFLNRGKAKNVKTGRRGSDGRMAFNKDMMEIVKLIAQWASESKDIQKLYLDLYALNDKYGFGHQQYDDSSVYFHNKMEHNKE